MTGALHQDRVKRSVLFGLFFLSGAAALIYQTSWHRLLGLFAGADTIAAAWSSALSCWGWASAAWWPAFWPIACRAGPR